MIKFFFVFLLLFTSGVFANPIIVTERNGECPYSLSDIEEFVATTARFKFETSIDSNDLRFLKVDSSTVGLSPFTLDKFYCLSSNNAIENLSLVSDFILCERQSILQDKAFEIEKEFNQLMSNYQVEEGINQCGT